jgi:hypothetical protein
MALTISFCSGWLGPMTALMTFFLGCQHLRLTLPPNARYARMEVEPEIIWREQLLQHRTAMAKEMAQDQIQAEKASYRSGKSCNGKGRKN